MLAMISVERTWRRVSVLWDRDKLELIFSCFSCGDLRS